MNSVRNQDCHFQMDFSSRTSFSATVFFRRPAYETDKRGVSSAHVSKLRVLTDPQCKVT